MNILIVGAQHGNEPLGKALMDYIKQHRPNLLPYLTYRTGNPRAKRAGVRYIESDLNRSYTGGSITYEERRAARLLAYIHKNNFDLVLDAHTTTCDQPPCFIAASTTGAVAAFMRASAISKVVRMHPDIAKTSLIGVCPQAVSIEIPVHGVTPLFLAELADALEAYINQKAPYVAKTMYEIAGFLAKSEISSSDAVKLKNFTKSADGYYPILVGENSYKKQTNYLGFKAYKVYKTKV